MIETYALQAAKSRVNWHQVRIRACHELKDYDALKDAIRSWTEAVKQYNALEREWLSQL